MFFFFTGFLAAQASWQFEFMPGLSLALPTPVSIRQDGFEDLNFWTSWKTEPLKFPLFYSYRLSRYERNQGWEIEMNHLKLYALDLPPEVSRFSITHGFNHLWVNRAWVKANFTLKAGAGIVLAHPENTIRDLPLDENRGIGGSGYYVAGPTAHFGMQRNIELGKNVFISTEAKCSFAFASVPVAGGRSGVPAVVFHFLAGLGLRTPK